MKVNWKFVLDQFHFKSWVRRGYHKWHYRFTGILADLRRAKQALLFGYVDDDWFRFYPDGSYENHELCWGCEPDGTCPFHDDEEEERIAAEWLEQLKADFNKGELRWRE